jgi:site-specific DNA-methyltransferase (adenine-specific)
MRFHGIHARWKAVLWFVKGTRDERTIVVNDVMSGGQEKSHHPWQQSLSEAEYWIEKLCPIDGIVCDPFLGSGTTAVAAKRLKRKWIGIEIDTETAKIASGRILG